MNSMSLPINIPWKLMASSRDMMDVSADDTIPYPWRSSLAIYAYEPSPADLDPALCDQRLVFIKVSATITGIQFSEEETKLLSGFRDTPTIVYPDQPAQTILENLIDAYYACYGVLLNVSIFPNAAENHGEINVDRYPHILDFEPKTRDLYQAATTNSEVLTASKGDVHADKSMSTVENSETGIVSGIKAPLGQSGATGNVSMSQKWGRTQNDSDTSSTDTSRERRESIGTSTNINQMYNLLTGYHIGSNRATFFIQPRPHTLQPTNRRTMVNGLREIEGIQDFFLVVTREKAMPGICVRARLETGHFPENVPTVPVAGAYEYKTKVISIDENYSAKIGEQAKPKLNFVSALLEVDNWEFDPDQGTDGHGSVTQTILSSDEADGYIQNDLKYYTDAGKLYVTASLRIDGPYFALSTLVNFARDYTVYLRRLSINSSDATTIADPNKLLIAQRTLDVCLKTGEDGCLAVETTKKRVDVPAGIRPLLDVSIVDEIDFRAHDLERPGAPLDTRTFYRRLQGKMTSSFRRPSRRPAGVAGLLDTDFVQNALWRAMPSGRRTAAAGSLMPDDHVLLSKLPPSLTVDQVLGVPLHQAAMTAGLPENEMLELRRTLLGLPQRPRRNATT
jgi:hypothetical protein